tara:strand:- start:750 stop:1007 length:258 start_codon:yes stop_codon:yes gene_type:complete
MWSRVMKVVPVSLFERFHRLFDSIPAHSSSASPVPMYAKAMQDHVAERGVVLPDSHVLRIALFINCNQIKTNLHRVQPDQDHWCL